MGIMAERIRAYTGWTMDRTWDFSMCKAGIFPATAMTLRKTALKQRLEQEINILHELRTRLISDVVTGQVDVRGIKVTDDEYINNEITEEEFEEESENNEEE